jgi:prolipoprotein diacylglyceryltransferase
METFLKTPVSHGPKQTVRSHTPPTPPDRQDDQTNKNNGSKKAKVFFPLAFEFLVESVLENVTFCTLYNCSISSVVQSQGVITV